MLIMLYSQTSDTLFIENTHICVVITRKWGGAITHVSIPGGENIINSHDLGRQIQQSYYSGPPNYRKEGKEKSKEWDAFPWNPIQTGDAYRCQTPTGNVSLVCVTRSGFSPCLRIVTR
jgi:hypothetical protein